MAGLPDPADLAPPATAARDLQGSVDEVLELRAAVGESLGIGHANYHNEHPMKPVDDSIEAPASERPSKSERKREAHDQQALGEALAELPDAALAAAPMPEILREAIAELRRTRSHEGRRRQLQYVGKLMRKSDVEPLREAVAAAQLGRAHDALALHRAEHWRAELVADDDALTRWMADHPDTTCSACAR